ncbi:hypothetical protein AB0878_46585 [Amycolatopsis sp. NPDC047767]|uniref:hypothetical protein n=1 Tax=Amycolatopsis sp. NPDC047767 TaxID=3156765 RepID=UPI0034512A43
MPVAAAAHGAELAVDAGVHLTWLPTGLKRNSEASSPKAPTRLRPLVVTASPETPPPARRRSPPPHTTCGATSPHNWTDATNLKPRDLLDTPGNGHATIQTLHRYSSSFRTYNLTIDTTHTYHVLAGTTPVLVHNSSCPVCENPGHHDPAGGRPNPYNRAKGVLPGDAEEQFANSVQVGKVRWTKIGSGRKAVYYRYSQHGDDVWHFSGSSNEATKSGVPVRIPLDDIPATIKRG